jgi:ABC-type nitrate/sulfonate/bicarbonate transport system substrate-binding protein
MAAIASAAPTHALAGPWRHGVIEPKSDAGFILMATTRDFATKNGLELQIVPLKNENLGLRGLISGELDSYEGSPPIAALAHGADVKELGCPWGQVPHVVFASTAIASMKDLAGHTMASSAPGSMPDLVGRAAMDKAGLAAGSVRLANVGGDADRYRALLGGVVDAAAISVEYAPLVDNQKVHIIARGSEVLPEILRICYQTTSKTIADRPDDVVKFLATEMQALRYALDHKAETIALAQQSTGQKPDDPRAAFMFDEVTRTGQIDPTLPLPVENFKAMQQTLQRMDVVPQPVDVSHIAAPEPRLKALALIGH